MPNPVRYTAGISTADANTTLSNYPAPDPTKLHVYWNDFNEYNVGDWTLTTTEAGAGSATEALTDGSFGELLVTNDAADNDSDFFQKIGESFLLTAGKKAWFKTRLKISDATESEFYAGLMVTDTDPFSSTAGDGVTDGVFFMKEDGSTALAIYCQKNATTGQTSATSIHTMAAATYVTLGWEYDGAGSLKYFINDVHKGTLDASSTYLPDTELTVSFGLKNGEAVAKTMTVDYIFAAIER